jgi:hypothetical protein
MMILSIGGKPLDPQQAIRSQMPLDPLLVCPACNGTDVEAHRALTVERFGMQGARITSLEDRSMVPKLQDRACLDCGYRWAAVLPPDAYTNAHVR